jgi:hypothetical protein
MVSSVARPPMLIRAAASFVMMDARARPTARTI